MWCKPGADLPSVHQRRRVVIADENRVEVLAARLESADDKFLPSRKPDLHPCVAALPCFIAGVAAFGDYAFEAELAYRPFDLCRRTGQRFGQEHVGAFRHPAELVAALVQPEPREVASVET